MDSVTIAGKIIPDDELSWSFSPSGGPGGQHANRSHTRAELRFDLVESASLADKTRRVLIGRFGAEIRIVVDETRSRHRNRQIALERLEERCAEALRPVKKRRPTKPSKGSQRRRLDNKRRRSDTKRRRQRPRMDD